MQGGYPISTQLNIAFDSLDATIVSAIDSVVCIGDTSAFSIPPTPNANYTWTVPGAKILSGTGTDSVIVRWVSEGGTAITVHEVLSIGADKVAQPTAYTKYM